MYYLPLSYKLYVKKLIRIYLIKNKYTNFVQMFTLFKYICYEVLTLTLIRDNRYDTLIHKIL